MTLYECFLCLMIFISAFLWPIALWNLLDWGIPRAIVFLWVSGAILSWAFSGGQRATRVSFTLDGERKYIDVGS